MSAVMGSDALSMSFDETLKLIRTGSVPDLFATMLSNVDPATYDEIAFSSTATTDVYVTKLATVTVLTYTVTYTDATKQVVSGIVAA